MKMWTVVALLALVATAAHANDAPLDTLAASFPPVPDLTLSLETPASHYNLVGVANAVDGAVQLTPATPRAAGGIWARTPLPDRDDWVVQFSFSVRSESYLGQHGLALWLVKAPPDAAASTEFFGHPAAWTGLAVVFDSVNDVAHRYVPQVTAVYNPGTLVVGTDAEAFQSQNALGRCFLAYRESDVRSVDARLSYIQGRLLAEFAVHKDGAPAHFTPCFSAEAELPRQYYVGMTAATGEFAADEHRVQRLEVLDVSQKPSSGGSAVPEPIPAEKAQVPEPLPIPDAKVPPSNEPKAPVAGEVAPTGLGADHANVLKDLSDTQKHIIHSLRQLQHQLTQNAQANSTPDAVQTPAHPAEASEAVVTMIHGLTTQVMALTKEIGVSWSHVREKLAESEQHLDKLSEGMFAALNQLRSEKQQPAPAPACPSWPWSLLVALALVQTAVWGAFEAYRARGEQRGRGKKLI